MAREDTRFRTGDYVRVRDERWRVVRQHPYAGCATIEVTGADVANRGAVARYLIPFDRVDPLMPPGGDRPRVVSASALRQAMRAALGAATPAWTSLRAAARARVSLLPFQLEPALAITRGLASRLLLADAVGLGKTIQAGLILSEVIARQPDARALIVTPAGLREQWQDELADRFSIDAVVLDAGSIARTAGQLPPDINPWSLPAVVITSIDFVKRPDVIRGLEALVWDLVVFDEAHGLTRASDRSSAAHLLGARGRRVLLLTATPHSGDDDSFARVCAIGALPGDDSPIMMFRRGREAIGCAISRRTHLLAVGPTPAERRMYEALESYARAVRRHAPKEHAAGARLVMGILARRACSSAASLARSVERRLALLSSAAHDTFQDAVGDGAAQLHLPWDPPRDGSDIEPESELGAPGLADRDAERTQLVRILDLARAASGGESKIAALTRFLRRHAEPAIVFTEYRDTLAHVAEALHAKDAAMLHGGLDASERRQELRRFTHGSARLLLATDAGSEGLNLHHRCRLVINLEVPWTPTRFEQRLGRIDRLGQTRRPHAITMAARGTFEDIVLARLLTRRRRVEEAAPFTAPPATSTPASVCHADLRDEAQREAARLTTVVRLLRHAGNRARSFSSRPPAGILGPSTAMARVLWALHLDFVDDRGAPVWQALVAPTSVSRRERCRSRRDVATWLAAVTEQRSPDLLRMTTDVHAGYLSRLAVDVRGATVLLASRERALDAAIRRERARLALPLLQPGLFDRRALRAAEAQERIADAALATIAGRLAELDRLRHPVDGDRALVFLAAIAG